MTSEDRARTDEGYALRAAALLRSAANDLKRDEVSAARDLGLELPQYREYLSGRHPPSWELIKRASEVWPVNERDLLPIHDDAATGVCIVEEAESRASSRLLRRGGHDYYEYRDTAMSRLSTFRPEYIRMLQIVDDNEPDNALVQWNDGHLLYQFTYFVGPVNYYYSWQGTTHCRAMSTGDSVWGVPFAPHSFAARSAKPDAYILALTYGGDLLGDAQREIAVLGPECAQGMALAPNDAGATLRSILASRLLDVSAAAEVAHLSSSRVAQLCRQIEPGTPEELEALARNLSVSVRDLLPRTCGVLNGVVIQPVGTAYRWHYPSEGSEAYEITRLAGDPMHPDTVAFEVTVRGTSLPQPELPATHQHSYLYVLAGGPVSMTWTHSSQHLEREIQPGASAYVRPGVAFALRTQAQEFARVLLLRIGGEVTSDARYALGYFDSRALQRYAAENRQWYRPDGRSASSVTDDTEKL